MFQIDGFTAMVNGEDENFISGTKSKTVQLSECDVDWKGFD